MITRLRLDAALYEPAPFRPPGTMMGRPRLKGAWKLNVNGQIWRSHVPLL